MIYFSNFRNLKLRVIIQINEHLGTSLSQLVTLPEIKEAICYCPESDQRSRRKCTTTYCMPDGTKMEIPLRICEQASLFSG